LCLYNVVLLFGRKTPLLPLRDCWTWESGNWRPLKASGTWPCARWSHAAVAVGKEIVLCGGRDANGFLPSHVYVLSDNTFWTQLEETTIPSIFAHAALARSTEIIFFGGNCASLNDVKVIQRDSLTLRWHPANRRYAHTVVSWGDSGGCLLVGGVQASVFGENSCNYSEDPFEIRYIDLEKDSQEELLFFNHNIDLKVLPIHAATIQIDSTTAIILGGGVPCFTFGPIFGESCSVHRAANR